MTDQNAPQFFYSNRKIFLVALLIGGFIGGTATFFIPKKYLSTAIIYPPNSHTQSEILANPQFGYEIETEQLLQLLSSKEMRDRTIQKFHLYDYYQLDTTDIAWSSKLTKQYVQDIQFLRSKYLSVVVNVEMKDPILASSIANFQIDEINNYRKQIFDLNRRQKFDHIEKVYASSNEKLSKLEDSIYSMRGNNKLLFNFFENLNNENYDPSDFVDQPELEAIVRNYLFEYSHNNDLRKSYEIALEQIEAPLPSVYTIDRAKPSYLKVSPSYTLNIFLGAFTFFLLVFVVRYASEKWYELKRENSRD